MFVFFAYFSSFGLSSNAILYAQKDNGIGYGKNFNRGDIVGCGISGDMIIWFFVWFWLIQGLKMVNGLRLIRFRLILKRN